MAAGFRHGILHHPLHGQDDNGVHAAEPGLHGAQGSRDQEQGGSGEDPEEDQGAEGSQRQGQEGHGQEGEALEEGREGGRAEEVRSRNLWQLQMTVARRRLFDKRHFVQLSKTIEMSSMS